MPLRTTLTSFPETLQEVELASEDRYWEAIELLVRGMNGGGMYLLGYVAEMLLKTAFLKLLSPAARPTERVASIFGPARANARLLAVTAQHESYHSVEFWAQLIFALRARLGRAFSPQLGSELLFRATQVQSNWSVDLRYHTDHSVETERIQLYEDVSWFRSNHAALWS